MVIVSGFRKNSGGNILTDPAWTQALQFVQATGAGAAHVVTPSQAKASLLERTNTISTPASGTVNVDLSTADYFDFTLAGNAPNFVFSAATPPIAGQIYAAMIKVRQAHAALYTNFTTNVAKWDGPGLVPVVPQVNDAEVVFGVLYDGTTVEGISPTTPAAGGNELGSSSFTANASTPSGGSVTLASLTIVVATRPIILRCFIRCVSAASAGANVSLVINDTDTVTRIADSLATCHFAGEFVSLGQVFARIAPSAGTHHYSFVLSSDVGVATAYATATAPGLFQVVEV